MKNTEINTEIVRNGAFLKLNLPSAEHNRGFTLLELLVVIALLSTMAWMTLGLVGNSTDQVHFEDTRNRLAAIRKAITGSSSMTDWESGFQGGFVVENGKLPEKISDLTATPAGYDSYGMISPLFDPQPDSNGINDGGETTLSAPAQQLLKGHRGSYIAGTDSDDEYRDGWGNASSPGSSGIDCPSESGTSNYNGSNVDADNYGWCGTFTGNSTASYYTYWPVDDLNVESYGRDGQEGEITSGDVYEGDTAMSEPVEEDDWRSEITGAKVTIVNQSGGDIDLPTLGIPLRVSLLIYINTASGGIWRRVTSDTAIASCLDGDDGYCNGSTALSSTTATFPTIYPKIPVGEHLLVLVADPDGTAESSDDTLDLSAIGATSYPITDRVKFYSRGGVLDMELRIR